MHCSRRLKHAVEGSPQGGRFAIVMFRFEVHSAVKNRKKKRSWSTMAPSKHFKILISLCNSVSQVLVLLTCKLMEALALFFRCEDCSHCGIKFRHRWLFSIRHGYFVSGLPFIHIWCAYGREVRKGCSCLSQNQCISVIVRICSFGELQNSNETTFNTFLSCNVLSQLKLSYSLKRCSTPVLCLKVGKRIVQLRVTWTSVGNLFKSGAV